LRDKEEKKIEEEEERRRRIQKQSHLFTSDLNKITDIIFISDSVTPTLIVSRIIKSALKLILDTLTFTIQHCHQDKSSTTTTTEVL
jgi:hypothetical protein